MSLYRMSRERLGALSETTLFLGRLFHAAMTIEYCSGVKVGKSTLSPEYLYSTTLISCS